MLQHMLQHMRTAKDLKIGLRHNCQFQGVQYYLGGPQPAETPEVFRHQRYIAILARTSARVVHEEHVLAGATKANVAQAAEGAACSY